MARVEPVRCRPARDGIVTCLMGMVVGIVLGASPWMMGIPTTDTLIFSCLMGGPLLLLALPGTLYLSRAAIIADEAGLRWRGMGRWRFVPWEAVTDYHCRGVRSSGTVTNIFSVETSAGNMKFTDKHWVQTEAIRERVVQNAIAARAHYWAVKGERPEDWPIVFHYYTKFNRAAPRELVIWHIATFVAVLLWFGYEWMTRHTLPSWGWLLTPTGLFLVAKEIALAAMHPRLRDTRLRVGEQITVFDDGLVFEDRTRRVETDWDGITDFFSTWCRAGGRYVVVTEQGEFDFLSTINNGELLERIIAIRAKGGAWGIWRYEQAWGGRTGRLTDY